jgi:hypothetical protein
MARKKEISDTRLNVSRYRVDRLSGEASTDGEPTGPKEPDAGQASMDQRVQFVELTLKQAMRRGDFDNLPGAGKPLPNLHQTDPDWWIRQKIESERITGLGPPALTLRSENAGLDARLDAAPSENAVRDILRDFNSRVIEARRQLQGGPPVVTPTRDADAEIALWRERRAERFRAIAAAREAVVADRAAMSWRERRRARRST